MIQNLCELFKNVAVKNPDKPAFFSKVEKKYESITYGEIYEKGLNLAAALIELGVKKGDKIALLSDNRLEWIISNFGILFTGSLDVPRGSNITDSEVEYILNHSEAGILFIEDNAFFKRIKPIIKKLDKIKHTVLMSNEPKQDTDFTLNELIEKGKTLNQKEKIENSFSAIKPEDLFTLIYTSGTMGEPKGVMLSHSNMVNQILSIADHLPIEQEERFLSILPIWHVYERVFCYYSIYNAGQTYYTNVRTFKEDLATCKPHYIASAPRLLESIYNGIFSKLKDASFIKKCLFHSSYFYAKKFKDALRFFTGVDERGDNSTIVAFIKSSFWILLTFPFSVSVISFIIAFFFKLNFLYGLTVLGLLFNFYTLDILVGKKLRVKLTGGYLRAFVCGGAALPKYIDDFFNNFGLCVLEGYGMTEMSPVITARRFKRTFLTTTGDPLLHTSIQIRDENDKVLTELSDGELKGKFGIKGNIFVNGKQRMLGYYKNEEETKKAILEGGWLNTGDIGLISKNRNLVLKGRAKETIVLLNGENLEPVPIENKLNESTYINQSVIFGQDRKFLVALLIPDFEHLTRWCERNNIRETSEKEIIKLKVVFDLFKRELGRLSNKKNGFKSYEVVKSFFLISDPFEIGKEITNLMKLKRNVIYDKYKKQIQNLYET